MIEATRHFNTNESPQQGQLVSIRKRPAIVRDAQQKVDPNTSQVLDILRTAYIDGWDFPSEDNILWQMEVGAKILSEVTLPNITVNSTPDAPERFNAFVDAIKWSSVGRQPAKMKLPESYELVELISPWECAVQIEDYQIYPVFKALAMQSVRLLLADDVGVGKTIEAGLIASELISQRRIRRIMIVCPASLQMQWRDEMKDKFNLDFKIIDSSEVFNIQKNLGMDANPWTSTPRIITSMDYLRQPIIKDRFCNGASRLQPEGSASLPFDLLIVDEAHNLSPSTFGDDSLRCQMLRSITKCFEHRLFLTATPHNGYTLSFTGLLELLDPVRFQQKTMLEERDNSQIQAVMVRRLKSELNENHAMPRFTNRSVKSLPLALSKEEKELFSALRDYRELGLRTLSGEGKKEKNLGRFIFSLLTKRLLSSSYAFARSWWRHIEGFELQDFGYKEAEQSMIRAELDLGEDIEKARREIDAVRHGAAWLKAHATEFQPALNRVSDTLIRMGWTEEVVDRGIDGNNKLPPDQKWNSLNSWIDSNLKQEGGFKEDERLIVFTEYKDTQDYLLWRLKNLGLTLPLVRSLYGGDSQVDRSIIKREFNDPTSGLRILVSTDAASEGLNLQTSCRYVIHQEIPWNPMRLEQRNGRVDRYGQSRDVEIFHFTSDDDADIQFLSYVAGKVDQVREDLGSAGQVLDEAITEHFTYRKLEPNEIDRRLEVVDKLAPEKTDLNARDTGNEAGYQKSRQNLEATGIKLGLNESNLSRLLKQALKLERGDLEETTEKGVYRLKVPVSWEAVVNTSLRIQQGKLKNSLPKLVFDPKHLEANEYDRRVFRPREDTALIRLGHPIMKKAVSILRRKLWEDSYDNGINRWTIVASNIPVSIDAIAVLYCQVLVRNKLGETVYSSVVELPFQLTKTKLIELTPELWDGIRHIKTEELSGKELEIWKQLISDCWLDNLNEFKRRIQELKEKVTSDFRSYLKDALKEQKTEEMQVYQSRIKELETEKSPRALERLRKELVKAEELRKQLTFYEEINLERHTKYRELLKQVSDADWERQHSQVMLLKQYLENDRKRLIEKVLPLRYALSSIDVQPAAVKIIVNGGGLSDL
ncbi:MAG: RNA polymerase-associated protein RapA [Candidatus Methanogaster sp.]|nr:MAG: RNA polymerase-associated protein RapA [ANME-2 cluster archaeon]